MEFFTIFSSFLKAPCKERLCIRLHGFVSVISSYAMHFPYIFGGGDLVPDYPLDSILKTFPPSPFFSIEGPSVWMSCLSCLLTLTNDFRRRLSQHFFQDLLRRPHPSFKKVDLLDAQPQISSPPQRFVVSIALSFFTFSL